MEIPIARSHDFNGAIIGMVLGDAHMSSGAPKGTAHDPRLHRTGLVLGHCAKQVDYMLWKAALLRNYLEFNPPREYNYLMKKTGKYYPSVYISSKRSFQLSTVYSRFYQFRKKQLSRKLLNRLTPLGLAIWYMDDGYLEKRFNKKGVAYPGYSLRLHTECFTYGQTLIARTYFLEVYGISVSVLKATNKKWVLWLSVLEAEKFLNIVRPYVQQVGCMHYKLPEHSVKVLQQKEQDIVRSPQECGEAGRNDQPSFDAVDYQI